MSRAAPDLTLDYRPSQPTGWFDPDRPRTLGGNTAERDFVHDGRSYRVSLLPFGRSAVTAPAPVYEDVPADPALRFRATVEAAFGDHYAFRFLGRMPDRVGFSVQSYSVFAEEQGDDGSGADPAPLVFGADLHVVYDPARRRSARSAAGAMRWIQVSMSVGTPSTPSTPAGGPGGDPAPKVDNRGPGNPFHPSGGSTSVLGRPVGNLSHGVRIPYAPLPGQGGTDALAHSFSAESFLAQETGRKDASGRAVVHVYGGLRHGWQLREKTGGPA